MPYIELSRLYTPCWYTPTLVVAFLELCNNLRLEANSIGQCPKRYRRILYTISWIILTVNQSQRKIPFLLIFIDRNANRILYTIRSINPFYTTCSVTSWPQNIIYREKTFLFPCLNRVYSLYNRDMTQPLHKKK